MQIYFSGIGGVGIGPLAHIAHDAGYTVVGSDMQLNPLAKAAFQQRGITAMTGQDGSQIDSIHRQQPIDLFVHTAALPADHPELAYCREHHIPTAKRDELLAIIIKDKSLKLVAIAGTHGKTTTTAMTVWVLQQLGVPVSYSVGSTLSFGPSGYYDAASSYFIYECDEFDRNMLHFWPELSLITSLDYDHPDSYPTKEDYRQAFVQFMRQSAHAVLWEREVRYLHTIDMHADYQAYDETMDLSHLQLSGIHNRQNAYLVEQAVAKLLPDASRHDIRRALGSFPGTGRRFEQLAPWLYTDYAHHPVEIAATLQMAHEHSDNVVVVYQPHQNIRQHEVKDQYPTAFESAEHVYWLPTYLSREDPTLAILSAAELAAKVPNAEPAKLDDELWESLLKAQANGALVVVMGAGDVDAWARTHVASQ